MNEIELLQRFRDDVPEPSTDAWLRARATLTAAKQDALVGDAPALRPARPTSRLRARPARWRAAALGFAGVAAVTALAVAVTGVPGHVPSPGIDRTQPTQSTGTIRTAGFVLTANANGTLSLTMSQVLDPAELQQALAQHGIPALVKTDTYCTSDPAAPDPTTIGVLSANPPFQPPKQGLVPAPAQPAHPDGFMALTKTTINPAAIPAGTELFFGYVPGDSLVSVGLIYVNSYTCSSQPPPDGPKNR
jgi:hypothetical protein